MSNRTLNAAIASAFAASLTLAAASVQAAEDGAGKEKCYGVATANHNDCASAGNNSCAGTSKADYEKAAWKYVAKGECAKTEVTLKDGSKRTGSLTPIKG